LKKKSFRKLSLRRETLTTLDLGRAAGGTIQPSGTETDLCTVVTGPNTCCCLPPASDDGCVGVIP
jgi:hypothetical protein